MNIDINDPEDVSGFLRPPDQGIRHLSFPMQNHSQGHQGDVAGLRPPWQPRYPLPWVRWLAEQSRSMRQMAFSFSQKGIHDMSGSGQSERPPPTASASFSLWHRFLRHRKQ